VGIEEMENGMSTTYDRMDAAIALVGDEQWWGRVASAPVISELVDRASTADAAGDSRGGLLLERLDEQSRVRFGVPAVAVAADTYLVDDQSGTHIRGLSSYASAKIAGIQAAEKRMNDFGLRSKAVNVERDFAVTEEAMKTLGAEGAAATLRVLDGIREMSGPDHEELLRMVWDLNAHPWDRGPLRDQAVYELEGTIHGSVEGIDIPNRDNLHDMVDAAVPEESRGVDIVAGIVSRANDRVALEARVARQDMVTNRSASAAGFPLSAGDSLLRARAAQSPTAAQRSTATASSSAGVTLD
jgi:hypothetical protein